jgi:hypothetical protein
MSKTHLLHIEYNLQKNGGETPRKITLPVSPERYAELLQGQRPKTRRGERYRPLLKQSPFCKATT